MEHKWSHIAPPRPAQGLDIVRIVVAIVLGVHSVYRILAGDVHGFGEFLSSLGFPFGVAFAWFVTLYTLACSVALVVNRWVVIACFGHLTVLVPGIFIEHARHGWFVVGGGRNGMEYSITLITCLFALIWSYWPRK
jgi:putative oxidoreductase